MESMSSIAPSAGSTTVMGLEDDANNFSMVQTGHDVYVEDRYNTPKRASSLPVCGSTYEPECDDSLQPSIGMRFDSWEAGLAFYRMYAHEVGFSVRIWTQHKGEGGVIVWKKFVCARQGWRKEKSVDIGQVIQEMQRKKAKRNIKISRCGCEAMMGLKRQIDNKYEVIQFVESHRHQLVSPNKRHLIRSNREIASFKWLFQTFLKAMCGAAPKLIITDEDQSMRRGIEAIFPNTKHRLCMWHILMKLPKKVGPILRNNEDFKPKFMACVWGSETPDEFESRWSSIISEFGLEDNEWLKEKYDLRQSWIPAYFMEFSLGGILRTTSRSESENAFFRHFTNWKLALLEFWVRFETALEEQRQKELQEDNSTLHTLPILHTCWGIEAHAREVYTHNIFVAFQREVVAARDRRDVTTIEQVGDIRTTSIADLSGRIRVVCSHTKVAQCTCRMFESLGILCSHIIVVLKNDGCNEIPRQYVLHRWTKMAAQHLSYDANGK